MSQDHIKNNPRSWRPSAERAWNAPEIYTADQLRAIIQYECARTARTEYGFSLLVFKVGESEPGRVPIHHLKLALIRRIRKTDALGWLAEDRIAVLLPHTPPEAAQQLAGEVSELIAKTHLVYAVYAYPSSQWPFRNLDGRGSQGGDSDSFSSHEETATWNLSTRQGLSSHVSKCSSIAEPQSKDQGSCNSAKELLPVEQPLFWKRAVDVAGASLGLALLSPLLLLISLLIKMTSPGPVIFRQLRVGQGGKPFWLYKFRTMKLNADTSVHQQRLSELMNTEQPMRKLDMDNDPRLIPFAKVFRTLGLDELPQLFNVIRGEMSLVGPRPCLPYEADKYRLWQTQRFDALPGLTGLWQVSGKNKTTFVEMMRLDIAYAWKRSLWLDLKIIFRTLPAIVNQIHDVSFRNTKEKNNGRSA